jgi:hypothetical protein
MANPWWFAMTAAMLLWEHFDGSAPRLLRGNRAIPIRPVVFRPFSVLSQ